VVFVFTGAVIALRTNLLFAFVRSAHYCWNAFLQVVKPVVVAHDMKNITAVFELDREITAFELPVFGMF